MIIYYAARTGTKRTLESFRRLGFGLMVSAAGVHRTEGFERYCLDNGAWTAHQQCRQWSPRPFSSMLASIGHGADFVVAPDVVACGAESLALSLSWAPRLVDICPVYMAVQNGHEREPGQVAQQAKTAGCVGIFVGGTTEWKERTVHLWSRVAHERGMKCHMGRVNSARRVLIAQEAGVDSMDGSGPTLYDATRFIVARALRQTTVFDAMRADKWRTEP